VGGFFQPIFFARPFLTPESIALKSASEPGPATREHGTNSAYGGHRTLGEAKAAYQPRPAGAPRLGWREATDQTVTGLGYELVDIERSAKGLLRVYIDRIPGKAYAGGEGEFVTVEDCEQVTRQLQYVLEVDGVEYSRLEVSSPGLDRPLRREADYQRFAGQEISVTLKAPFQGRKVWKGRLEAAEGGGWVLHFHDGKADQVLAFALDEVREARLVPVLDFKGRRGSKPAAAPLGDDGGSVR
jgi:ribosome maturation factor RimP